MINKRVILGSLIAGAFILPSVAGAAMTGVCSTCHTMHNSQNGTAMAPGTTLATPNAHLLMADCAGCHANAETNTASGKPTGAGFNAPQVDGTATSANQNAGGYFQNATNEGFQHNVFDIWGAAGTDSVFDAAGLNTIPGDAAATYTQTTCVTCHSGSGGHHAAAPTAVKGGTAANDTYRLLGAGGVFVAGTGVVDFGVNDSTVSTYAQDVTNDMNKFCAACHQDFHGEIITDPDVGAGGSWIRHPVGVTLGAGMDTAYNAQVIVGEVPVMGADADTQRIVMCISCHRPHGSQYADLLRWSYGANVAGGGGAALGCETCHSIAAGGY